MDMPVISDSMLGNMFNFNLGARVDAVDCWGYTPLIWAAEKGYGEVVHTLLRCNANVNHENFYGATALMRAAKKGEVKCCEELIEHKADMTMKMEETGHTALMFAVKERKRDVVNL